MGETLFMRELLSAILLELVVEVDGLFLDVVGQQTQNLLDVLKGGVG